MLNLRNYKKKKEKNEFHSKLIKHRLVVIYRTILVLVTIVIVGLVIYLNYENKIYSGYDVISSVERQDSDTAIYLNYSNNILKYSQDGAEAFDSSNKVLWNETYEMQDPAVKTCGEYVAIGDYKGNRILVINNLGKQGTIETKMPVSNFCISSQGVVAAVLEDDEITRIQMYSKTGEELVNVKCTMTQSGYPIDISLSDDGCKLAVSYMRIQNGELRSSVAFYNFDDVGQNEIDRYVSGYDYLDTVIPKVKFINNSTAFCVGDNRFVIFKGNQKPMSEFETSLDEEVKSVFYSEKNIGLVYRISDGNNKYRIDVYNEDGELSLKQEFNMEYTDIILKNDFVIIYNDTKCIIFNKNGVKKYEGEFTDSTLLVVPTDSKTKYILINREESQTIRLH